MTNSIAHYYRRTRGVPECLQRLVLNQNIVFMERVDREYADGRMVFLLVYAGRTKAEYVFHSKDERDLAYAEARRQMREAEKRRRELDHETVEGVNNRAASEAWKLRIASEKRAGSAS